MKNETVGYLQFCVPPCDVMAGRFLDSAVFSWHQLDFFRPSFYRHTRISLEVR